MHRVDATNNVTVSGKRRFSNGPPGTALAGNWHNAMQEEVANVIEGEGIELIADGATDVAGSMSQLLQAVRRSSHRHHSSLVQVAAINNGSGFEIELGEETRILSITQTASFPYAPFNILNSLSTYERRELIIRNDSGSPKVFSMGDSRYLDLYIGQCVRVLCVFGGGVTWWRSLSHPERFATTMTLRAPSSAYMESGTGYVSNFNGFTNLIIPPFRLDISAAAEASIALIIPNIALPWMQSSPSGTRRIVTSAVGISASTLRLEMLTGALTPNIHSAGYFGLGYETRSIEFFRPGDAAWPIGEYCALEGQVITIRNQYP